MEKKKKNKTKKCGWVGAVILALALFYIHCYPSNALGNVDIVLITAVAAAAALRL
jgi:hypothetical protein